MTTCAYCKRELTWAESRRSFARLCEAGMTPDEIKHAGGSFHSKCATALKKEFLANPDMFVIWQRKVRP